MIYMKQRTKERGIIISFLITVFTVILRGWFKNIPPIVYETMIIVALFSFLSLLFFVFFEKISEFFSDL